MADIYVKSGGGTIGSGSYRGNWTASQTYALGDRVCGVATSDYWMFECTTAGTAGGTEPTWVKTAGSTTTDGAAVWAARIPSTWANATLSLNKASVNSASSDNIYVSQSHTQTILATNNIAFAGTRAAPNRIICANDNAEPPTSAASYGAITTTSGDSMYIRGSLYAYGLIFAVGSSISNVGIYLGDTSTNHQFFENCKFRIVATGSFSQIQTGCTTANNPAAFEFKNCWFKFATTGRALWPNRGKVRIIGGGLETGTSAITVFISSVYDAADILVSGFDFTGASSALSLVVSGVSASGRIDFVNCKMPNSWSGGLVAGAPASPEFRASMYNCDSGNANYNLWIEAFAGSIKSETALVKIGGASDGTTAISWKLVSSANAKEVVSPLTTDNMAKQIDIVGQSKTITVDILHDSATALTDAEIWLEIDYLGSTSSPIGIPASDKRATVLTTPADQATSTATWNTTGMTNPNKQKLEITFTPQMRGFVYARVCLAKPSYTVYVDPKLVVV